MADIFTPARMNKHGTAPRKWAAAVEPPWFVMSAVSWNRDLFLDVPRTVSISINRSPQIERPWANRIRARSARDCSAGRVKSSGEWSRALFARCSRYRDIDSISHAVYPSRNSAEFSADEQCAFAAEKVSIYGCSACRNGRRLERWLGARRREERD